MPLDEMHLMLEQWGNITGEPRGVDYTEGARFMDAGQ
jgi:hypothetical protein